ncbi:MAG: nitroreductase family protein [Patescibacteria group bacterium]
MKSKKTKNPVHELLRNRWSPRSFSSEDITDTELATILEAAACAPSAFNKQPWQYLYARRGTQTFEKMLSCIAPMNATWAKNAAVLMFGVLTKDFDGGRTNLWAEHDMGAAEMSMYVQATALGIYGHTIAGYWHDPRNTVDDYPGSVGFDKEEAKKLFVIPKGYEPYDFLAFGRLGAPELLPAEYQEAERADKPIAAIETFAFKDEFPKA